MLLMVTLSGAQTAHYPSTLYTYTHPAGVCNPPIDYTGCITALMFDQLAEEMEAVQSTLGTVTGTLAPTGLNNRTYSLFSTADRVRLGFGLSPTSPATAPIEIPIFSADPASVSASSAALWVNGTSLKMKIGATTYSLLSGAVTFPQLADVPDTYVGSAGYFVRVNGTADGIMFSQFVNLATDTTGSMPRSRGGLGADTSAYGASVFGSDSANVTVKIGTVDQLETALGGVHIPWVNTNDITSADLALMLSDETGTGGGFVRAIAPTLDSPAFINKMNWPRVTSMPVAPNNGDTVTLVNATAAGSCTPAAGTVRNICQYDGSLWQPLGGGSGGGSGDITDVGNCTTGACFQSETTNKVLAAPNGSTGQMSPRVLVNADLPDSGVTGTTCGDATHSCGLTYNSKGVLTAVSNPAISGAGGSSLEVKETDGTPDVTGVGILQVPVGSLTNNTGGNVTLAQTDATMSTSDITTNNVSTSKHGFAPKSDGNAAHYLDGTGAYSTPAGGGGGGGGVGGPVPFMATTNGASSGTTFDATAARYFSPTGVSPFTTNPDALMTQAAAGTYKKLACWTSATAQTSTKSVAISLNNGTTDSALTCSINSTSTCSTLMGSAFSLTGKCCEDTTHSVSTNVADSWVLKTTPANTPNVGAVTCGMEFTPTGGTGGNGRQLLTFDTYLTSTTNAFTVGSPQYLSLTGGGQSFRASGMRAPMPFAGTFKNLVFAVLTSALTGAQTVTVALFDINAGALPGATCTITSSSTCPNFGSNFGTGFCCEATTSQSVSVGQRLVWQVSTTNSPTGQPVTGSVELDSDSALTPTMQVVTKSADYTIVPADLATSQTTMFLCDTSGAARTLTLPSASAVGGKTIRVKRLGTTNKCTVSRAGSDTIYDNVAITARDILNDGESIDMTSDGSASWPMH